VIFLIRHGETAWSLSGQHTGKTDLPLTSAGEVEARRLRAHVDLILEAELGPRPPGAQFDAAFSSPRRRARDTGRLSGLTPDAEVREDLAEWDYGDYEGLTSVEIQARQPDGVVWNVFRNGCPNGESPEQMTARVDGVISWLRTFEGHVAICAHGHFGRALGARWIGLPIADAGRLLLSTASVSILDYEHNDPARPAIKLWNEVAR